MKELIICLIDLSVNKKENIWAQLSLKKGEEMKPLTYDDMRYG